MPSALLKPLFQKSYFYQLFFIIVLIIFLELPKIHTHFSTEVNVHIYTYALCLATQRH